MKFDLGKKVMYLWKDFNNLYDNERYDNMIMKDMEWGNIYVYFLNDWVRNYKVKIIII